MDQETPKSVTLKQRWEALVESNAGLRIRDAADELGVSEGELLATEVGISAVRLRPEFKELLQCLHELGRVMALTRNDEIVHERKGVYKNAQTEMAHGMALFVNPDIDLRIFTGKWHACFAVEVKNSKKGKLRSLQIFDKHGSAIHKIYLLDESDLESYQALVAKFRSADQSTNFETIPKSPKKRELSDSEIDVNGFQKAWSEMKDTHDFFPLINKFKVSRLQALRLADREYARELSEDIYKNMLESARDRNVPIMVFVGNDGIIQIHTGTIENVIEARGWFNVMDKDFNLHIDQAEIGSAWLVRKPTSDGIVTSIELFNKRDDDVALFFGKRKPGIPELAEWSDLVADLALQTK
jgi:putative hemin transport protein